MFSKCFKVSHTPLFFALSALILCTVACVDDVDFDTTDQIVLSPEVDVDLIYFNLDTDDFAAITPQGQELVFQDITRLEFLNDDFTQENLIEIELDYLVTSTLSQSITNTSRFLDNAGNIEYEISFPINPSTNGVSTETSFTTIIPESDIQAIRNSIQLENEVRVSLDGNPVNGEIILQSKAIYSLVFQDL